MSSMDAPTARLCFSMKNWYAQYVDTNVESRLSVPYKMEEEKKMDTKVTNDVAEN